MFSLFFTFTCFNIIFSSILFSSETHASDPECSCVPQRKDFNETIKQYVSGNCKRCYYFQVRKYYGQTLAINLCVDSEAASLYDPLFVVVGENLNVMSFRVPRVFPGKRIFPGVCKTLCPISIDPSGIHNLTVSIYTTSKNTVVDFEMRVSLVEDFIIKKDESLTVSITPTKPHIMQYNMEKYLRSVRIEAISNDSNCMILAIQGLECPTFGFFEPILRKGFYQTFVHQAGISIQKDTFPKGMQYVVLTLQPTDESCTGVPEIGTNITNNRQKDVTITVVKSITVGEIYGAIFKVFGCYMGLWGFAILSCCCLFIARQGTTTVQEDIKLQDVTTPMQGFLSNAYKNEDTHVCVKSNMYTWNLISVAIFYALPSIQLVYLNQRIVNLTGNQDVCYYNFLCSHKVGMFSDFNHLYSNIGYILLGILFLILVWRRKSLDRELRPLNNVTSQSQRLGLPRHYGLMYAMGWALVIEGLLSATYHVCPNKSNFQFDTSFMYIIAVICMLKLYHARHPDITVESHKVWILIGVVIIFAFVGGVIVEGVSIWIIFMFAHLFSILYVYANIYYEGTVKFGSFLYKILTCDYIICCSPTHPKRLIMLWIAFLMNLVLGLVGIFSPFVDFDSHILVVFGMNLIIYLIYYGFMKKICKEHIKFVPVIYFILLCIFWPPAVYYFKQGNTQWELTPAMSREGNRHCILFNFFDDHDVWHLLSSCALFFTYMFIFTLDDDIENKPRTRISIF